MAEVHRLTPFPLNVTFMHSIRANQTFFDRFHPSIAINGSIHLYRMNQISCFLLVGEKFLSYKSEIRNRYLSLTFLIKIGWYENGDGRSTIRREALRGDL